jgi:hypothetical protein
MSKAFAAFYDDLLPELPGVATGMLDLQLLRVAREFCERSAAWRVALAPFPSKADRLTYSLFSPESKTEVVRLVELSWGDTLQWRAREPDPHDTEQPRFPAHRPPFTIGRDGTEIELTEQPTGTIGGIVAIRPSLVATTLPDVLQTEHLAAIRAGVLARLMLMGDKPWTDRITGIEYRNAYEARINFSAQHAARGNTKALLRTRPTQI